MTDSRDATGSRAASPSAQEIANQRGDAYYEDCECHSCASARRETYPGEPSPAEMIRDLQEAVHGFSYATAHSPQQEWRELLRLVRTARARRG